MNIHMTKDNNQDTKVHLRRFFTTQTWWGKVIGAFMGYLIAGPAGALFGILVGNFFDRGLAEHYAHPYWYYHTESRKQIQKLFFETTFAVMGHIAKADGRISEQEIKMASLLMQEMKLNSTQQKQARKLYREGKEESFNLKQSLTQLRTALELNPELLKLFVEIQYRAASVDGLTQNKIDALNTILLYLGFAPLNKQNRFYEDYDYNPFNNHQKQSYSSQRGHSKQSNYQYYHRSNSSLEQAFGILNVPSSASKQEVKKAYRRQMSKNHPDKLIAQGLPEEMIRLANDKTQKISKAYDQICQSKGW
jgi:DnaJ like chaperone protein